MDEESNDLKLNENTLIDSDERTTSLELPIRNDNVDDNMEITQEDENQINKDDDADENFLDSQFESNVNQDLSLDIINDTEKSNILIENLAEDIVNDVLLEASTSVNEVDAESKIDHDVIDNEKEISNTGENMHLYETIEIEPKLNDNENSEEPTNVSQETTHETAEDVINNAVELNETTEESEQIQTAKEEVDPIELSLENENDTVKEVLDESTSRLQSKITNQAAENDDNIMILSSALEPVGNKEISQIIEGNEVVIENTERDRSISPPHNKGEPGIVIDILTQKVDCSADTKIEIGLGASFEDQEATNQTTTRDISSPEPIPVTQNVDHVSNFFTAHIHLDDGTVKNQIVTIIDHKYKKPFLGGYRHKLSGVEYHNAAIQTRPRPRPPPAVELFSRDTQTFQIRHQKVNTSNTTSTQMTQVGVFVSNTTDKLIVPGQYETAEDFENRMLRNIIIIQKYYRRWLARQIVDRRRQERDKRLAWEQSEKDAKLREKEERIKHEYERRMHPKTRSDFDLLYNGLEKWRQEQLAEINASDMSTAEKKAAKLLLLDEETDLLAAIDRHKIDRSQQSKSEELQKLLGKAAAPKTWKDTKGRPIQMDTPYTIRSRELLDILNSLNMQYLTHDERLDVLLTLKHTVKEHDCKLTRDIIDLVDREADLIMRDVKDITLAGLRKRIVTLFLQYCKTPTFNPEISLLLKVPPDPSVLIGDINYCKYCGRYLRITEFSLSIKSSKLMICKSCARKENQSRNRQDYSHYRRILKDLHIDEQQIGDNSKIAFILKQNDIKTLMESVWDSKSILSECEDFDELVFVRWDSKQHWSPWNAVLLTKDEAEAHGKVKDLTETYSKVMINRINQKHVIAKNMFESLEKMTEKINLNITKSTVKV